VDALHRRCIPRQDAISKADAVDRAERWKLRGKVLSQWHSRSQILEAAGLRPTFKKSLENKAFPVKPPEF
jgi:hypothetical protein